MHTAFKKAVLLFGINLFPVAVYSQNSDGYPMLDYATLEKSHIRLPYKRYYGSDSNLLVYGSNHTTNPDDPQVNDIEEQICKFRPDIVLYEGDGIGTEKTKRATVSTYFEMGLVKYIADSLQIPAMNIEPQTSGKYAHLASKFSADEVLLATLGLQITMMQVAEEPLESKFDVLIGDLIKEGLQLTPDQKTLQHFFRTYKDFFKKDFSYANFDSRDIQAKYNRTSLNKVNQEANRFRDKHIVSLVERELKKGRKVYLQIGGWHAIVCEPAFHLMTKK